MQRHVAPLHMDDLIPLRLFFLRELPLWTCTVMPNAGSRSGLAMGSRRYETMHNGVEALQKSIR